MQRDRPAAPELHAPPAPRLIPEDLKADLLELRTQLERWQAGLRAVPQVEGAVEIENALQTLISALELQPGVGNSGNLA